LVYRQSIVFSGGDFSHAKPEEHAIDFAVRRSTRLRANLWARLVICDPNEERKSDGV
jgi:hypothetical protein